MFIGPPNAQATTEVFEWPELTAVTDLASAKAAIELIVEQGEGARGERRSAHFGKFVALLQAYRAARAVDPAFEPARPVEPAYVRRPPDVEAEVATVGDPSRPRSPTCSTRSMRPLQALSRYFVHSGETDDQVEQPARTAKHLMNRVMRPTAASSPPCRWGRSDPGCWPSRPSRSCSRPSMCPTGGGLADPGRAAGGAGRPDRTAAPDHEPGTARRTAPNCRAWPTTSKRPDNPPTPPTTRCHLSTVEVVMASGPPPTSSSRSCSPPGCGASTGWWGTASTRWWTPSATTTASSGSMCATRRPARSRGRGTADRSAGRLRGQLRPWPCMVNGLYDAHPEHGPGAGAGRPDRAPRSAPATSRKPNQR